MSKNVKKLITLCEGFLRDVRDLHAPCGPIRWVRPKQKLYIHSRGKGTSSTSTGPVT
jgi:hypothetical protein